MFLAFLTLFFNNNVVPKEKQEKHDETTSYIDSLSKDNLSISVNIFPKILRPNKSFNVTVRLKNIGTVPVRVVRPTWMAGLHITILKMEPN